MCVRQTLPFGDLLFTKERNDDDLSKDLLMYSMDKPRTSLCYGGAPTIEIPFQHLRRFEEMICRLGCMIGSVECTEAGNLGTRCSTKRTLTIRGRSAGETPGGEGYGRDCLLVPCYQHAQHYFTGSSYDESRIHKAVTACQICKQLSFRPFVSPLQNKRYLVDDTAQCPICDCFNCALLLLCSQGVKAKLQRMDPQSPL